MLERTYATTNEVLEPITFVLAYPTVFQYVSYNLYHAHTQCCLVINPLALELDIYCLTHHLRKM